MFVAIIIFIIITMKDGVRSLVSSLVSDYHIQNCKIKKNIYIGKPRQKANQIGTEHSWCMRKKEVGCKRRETEAHFNLEFWN